MIFKNGPLLPGAGRTRVWHHHGSHTPTSPGTILLGKMAYHTKKIRRECRTKDFELTHIWFNCMPNRLFFPKSFAFKMGYRRPVICKVICIKVEDFKISLLRCLYSPSVNYHSVSKQEASSLLGDTYVILFTALLILFIGSY